MWPRCWPFTWSVAFPATVVVLPVFPVIRLLRVQRLLDRCSGQSLQPYFERVGRTAEGTVGVRRAGNTCKLAGVFR